MHTVTRPYVCIADRKKNSVDINTRAGKGKTVNGGYHRVRDDNSGKILIFRLLGSFLIKILREKWEIRPQKSFKFFLRPNFRRLLSNSMGTQPQTLKTSILANFVVADTAIISVSSFEYGNLVNSLKYFVKIPQNTCMCIRHREKLFGIVTNHRIVKLERWSDEWTCRVHQQTRA